MNATKTIARWHSATALLALALAGCFSEAPLASAGSGTGTDCPIGEETCPCNEKGACFEGLVCNTANNCVEDGCVPGKDVYCSCDNSTCAGDAVCVDDICRPPSSTTTDTTSSTTATDSSTSGPTTASGTTDPMTSTTDPTVSTAVSTTLDETESSSSDTGTTGTEDCSADATCGECISCSIGAGGACHSVDEECTSVTGCQLIVGCFRTCAQDGICDPCCELGDAAAEQAANAVSACYLDECNLNSCVATSQVCP